MNAVAFHHILEAFVQIIQVAELGATLVKLIDKASGQDLVLGFESEEEYLANSGPNLGATIGRNANRIGEARFKLNGREYKLSVKISPIMNPTPPS